MTLRNAVLPPLLRNVDLRTQPRVLARPGRAPAAPVVQAAAQPGPVSQEAEPLPHEVFEQAHARGLEEGREAGLQLGLQDARSRLDEAVRAAQADAAAELEERSARLSQQWSDRLARLDAAVQSFEQGFPAHMARLEVDAAVLAFEAVCRLLGDAPGRRQAVEDLVGQAIGGLRSRPLRVRLGAADLALLDEDDSGLRSRYPQVEWLADAAVVSGGCLVDTEDGTLDARLQTQLQRLLQQWRQATDGAGGTCSAA